MTFLRSIEDEGQEFHKTLALILQYFAFPLLSSDLCRNDNVYGMLRPKIRAEALCFIDLEK
jgi:hypothetical protein